MDLKLQDIVVAIHGSNATELQKALTWAGAGAVFGVVATLALTGRIALAPLWVPFWVWGKLYPQKVHAEA